jgi:predicted kinase
MEKVLIIVRGIPGCGKSTFAKLLGGKVFTADDYFMVDGVYSWNPEKIGAAHSWCQSECERYMKYELSPAIVANTSTTEKELKPYYDLAEKYGYKVFSVIVENRHNGVNEHNVPEEALQKMIERFTIKLI